MKNRLERIREQVKIERKVIVSQLSKTYGVTEETIRRDLEKLEAEGFLTRTYGGAVINVASQKEHVHYYKRMTIQQAEKKKMAKTFLEIVKTKRTISADASTTVMEMCRAMRDLDNLTMLSTSTEIFRELADSEINIISLGGSFNGDTLSLQGRLTKENIKRYHVDLTILSCKGLDMEKGITDTSEREADVKAEMIRNASEVAILADYTKFDKTAFVKIMDWERVTYLVTDRKPSDEWVDFCRESGISLLY